MGKIWRIAGPIVIAEGMGGSKIYEVVEVGEQALLGEIIGLEGERATIQVYEDTSGLRVGDEVLGSGKPLVAELGPGLIGSIYDGLQKALISLKDGIGPFLKRGLKAKALDRGKRWRFVPKAKRGDFVRGGDILGIVRETPLVEHRVMVPPNLRGKLKDVRGEGDYTVEEWIAILEGGQEIRMMHEWPVRRPRPYASRLDPSNLLVTGMRIMDYMFPMALGGKGAIPGGFGTGKTVALQQLARWAQTHINIYIGCGERGNEMADVLKSFLELKEPRTGRPLMEKEIFIANTSNMPVVAREASVFLGITMAEYFRDMGYNVLLVADSTSRWAEAMREIGGRLEEMPGEEGFPAYLGSSLSSFYERSGRVKCLGDPERVGSVTVVGAVSPPGADFSEPVTQNTLRIVEALYSLDVSLANRRHFPAISWLSSYSLYVDEVEEWWRGNVGAEWKEMRNRALKVLQEEAELQEIVRLVGPEALPEKDKLTLLIARMIREDFLMQSAYSVDTYCAPAKAHLMMKTIMAFYDKAQRLMEAGAQAKEIQGLPVVARIARMKEIPNEVFEERVEEIWTEIEEGLVRT
ncbi:MAG: V-type ATP synthase subunit A [Candidatus Bathyarchaeia archaeon]